MNSRTSLTVNSIIIFCLLCVVGKSIAAMEEAPSSPLHSPRLNPLLNNLKFEEPSEKRAPYTYTVSGYKRLPLYNFGLGKRWVDNSEDKRTWPFSFGIGKRLRDYNFGLGKRNNGYHPLNLDYFSADNLESYHSREDGSDDFMEDKRGIKPFSFGLGKRAWKLATGESPASGKEANDVVGPKYLLSLGKGMIEDEELAE
ncbi:hypothetical protein DMN91_003631 [Ooceraea biroi]|uniref:Allatostatins n=1 Tax=Ooceraea biroi TaxID=2015173 RepID=A0A026W6J2_OOCBI|nr:allatostatin A [Ooceraea biroi]EZA50639.1 Allatostatins [Ooceraea biroi]RLU23427.1 hypothetical protein DMN91_003631 [Ooceraea biroi]